MEDLTRYVCKDCGQSNFIEWQSHRMHQPGATVGINSSIICLSCMQTDTIGMKACGDAADKNLQIAS